MKPLILIFAITLFACSSKKDAASNSQAKSEKLKTNEVQLTDDQFKSINIKLGSVEVRSLSANIKARGVLDVPPQNLVSISAPLGGFVKSTELLQGMRVKVGQVIVVLEHPDYIQLQQDYLESKNQLEFLEMEYTRQVDLAKENVNALKSLQQAKSNYFGMKAKVEGLKAKLKLVNINPIDLEKGEIKNTISIVSPINGFVSQVNVNLGMHVNPTDVMFKLIDIEHVHAEAQVFEKDVPKLKIGQLARIYLSNETSERIAKVFLIGKEITAERTIRVHCHLEGEEFNLIPGTYFNAVIETGSTDVTALPQSAIVNFNGKYFIFAETNASNHQYELLEVEVGASNEGYVQISSAENLESYKGKIVLEGGFQLLNVLKNSDE